MHLTRLTRFFVDEALPVWARIAFDERTGHFMEALELDGSADRSGIVRTRTAARQIYVFAHASVLGVAPGGSLEKAETAFANLHACTWTGGDRPGYARAFDRFTGTVTDPERDLYDHACVLLALAWLWKATGKDIYRTQVDSLLDAIDVTLAAPFGGWSEDSAGSLPRRQNPHMHFFESCLALCEVSPDTAYMARADTLYDLFGSKFIDGSHGPLREFFGPDWEVADRFGSHRLEPGHMVEWVWLIRRYEKLKDRNENQLCAALLETALTIGRDQPTPFLVDEASEAGVPLKPSRRLWPQAELLKAYIMQHAALGDPNHHRKAEELAAALMDTYLTGAPEGCWRDCFDLAGNATAKSIPASSLYHLWTGVAELLTQARAA